MFFSATTDILAMGYLEPSSTNTACTTADKNHTSTIQSVQKWKISCFSEVVSGGGRIWAKVAIPQCEHTLLYIQNITWLKVHNYYQHNVLKSIESTINRLFMTQNGPFQSVKLQNQSQRSFFFFLYFEFKLCSQMIILCNKILKKCWVWPL